MKNAYREYVIQCESNGDTPVEPRHWPDGTYGGTIQLLLGVGSLDFKVIFNYRGLVFILHHLYSDRKVCFGGSYRPKNKNPSMKDFNTPMMATMEDIESSEIQDSRVLTNHNASHDQDLQQNISRVTGDSKDELSIT